MCDRSIRAEPLAVRPSSTPVESEYCPDVVAVLVTHNPAPKTLLPAIESVARQVSAIVVVDNASEHSPLNWIDHASRHFQAEVEVLVQEDNLGLAAGYNVGLDKARSRGAVFVLLLDQDSELEFGTVAKLRAAHLDLAQRGVMAAAVGPRYRDASDASLSQFVRAGCFRFKRVDCGENGGTVEADFLISSGSLLPMAAIETIGKMDEGLYIDHIDTEWCFRARSLGFGIFGVCDAIMRHALGERRVAIWFLRWRRVPVHSPFRYYYIVRNSILLRRRSYMPKRWRRADLSRLFQILFFFGLLTPNRLANLHMMWFGLRDGMNGVEGKLTRLRALGNS
ncbi:glycosyltransferase family 2 protein [Accumulibacter sp.]|uniref:glycosyltransferase family 2 protein n=1 Tax=Accumulibacter sp. TaxID=2053492 RepID=UPI002BC39677|nr:glycosyltransferase family 2 protein [Accumulibacter sp.]HNC19403.1 glycosyltransferase family 2 protein [Accumulibacter sp.]